jgi:type II restriction enzyme
MLTAHISNPADLVTSHRATVEGFLSQALAKSTKAAPLVEATHKFWLALQSVQDINSLDKLLDNPRYRSGLIAAAGFSQKATNHLTKEELDEAIKRVFLALSQTSGETFREEILYRYLLTLGDTLGGQMRNYIGADAGIKFTRAILDALPPDESLREISENKKGKIQRIAWERRLLLFDVKPKLISNNVDAILLSTSGIAGEDVLSKPSQYLACGELKGGIDPAGADEHWKTARSALHRIRDTFQKHGHTPALFFIGAAIEARMAEQIFADLVSGELTYAANLTVPEQVSDLARWLVSL